MGYKGAKLRKNAKKLRKNTKFSAKKFGVKEKSTTFASETRNKSKSESKSGNKKQKFWGKIKYPGTRLHLNKIRDASASDTKKRKFGDGNRNGNGDGTL